MENPVGNKKISLVGIGDYGISVIRDFGGNLLNVECLEMNTDWAFMNIGGNTFIKIGTKTTLGMGAGALAAVGEKATEEDKQTITDSLSGSQLLLIVSGLGGGTGSGASPVVASIAKKLNIPTIAFVTTPPKFEGEIRRHNAQSSIDKLKKIVDVLFSFPSESLEAGIVFNETDKAIKKSILEVLNLIDLEATKNKTIQEILEEIEFKNF